MHQLHLLGAIACHFALFLVRVHPSVGKRSAYQKLDNQWIDLDLRLLVEHSSLLIQTVVSTESKLRMKS